jgi:hypothetical protein
MKDSVVAAEPASTEKVGQMHARGCGTSARTLRRNGVAVVQEGRATAARLGRVLGAAR